MRYILFFFIVFIISCSQKKSILICGDHRCINKAEAKQYFEDNLTLEVQIISKNNKKSFNLIDLNINESNPKIKVIENKNKKVIKELSTEEIKAKKAELKIKKKQPKVKIEEIKKIKIEEKKLKNIIEEKKPTKVTSIKKFEDNSKDICLKLEKCDIESITEYLIKVSNKKDYPNISTRE